MAGEEIIRGPHSVASLGGGGASCAQPLQEHGCALLPLPRGVLGSAVSIGKPSPAPPAHPRWPLRCGDDLITLHPL